MFVNVEVLLPESSKVVAVPVTAVVHAAYGDSVFVIEPKKDAAGSAPAGAGPPAEVARQQFVRLGGTRGDFVSIEEGVSAGERVVTAGAFKLRNGAPVTVKNEVVTEPKLDPRPPNR
jgi:membrane fusion protein (multidrug efflux system)